MIMINSLTREPNIQAVKAELGLKAFPNPTTGITTIVLGNRQDYNMEVFDVLGSLVHRQNGNGKLITLDLEFLAAGQYVVKVNNCKNFSLIKL